MTNNTNKITYAELYKELLKLDDVQSNPLWVEKLENALASVTAKAENKKATKVQIENEEIKSAILDTMVSGQLYTCSQIIKMLDDERVSTTQKVTALFISLSNEGKVERIRDKKTTYFKKI